MVTSEINTAIFFVPDDAILGDNEEITHLGFRKEFIFSYLLILILELYRIINELLEYILKLFMQLKKNRLNLIKRNHNLTKVEILVMYKALVNHLARHGNSMKIFKSAISSYNFFVFID